LYNPVAGGVSDVVGVDGHERRLVLVTKGGLDSVTEGLGRTLVRRLARRLKLTKSLVGRLVAGRLVGRELVVAGLVVRGLVVVKLVKGSFVVNRSKSLSLSLKRRVFEDIKSTFYSVESRLYSSIKNTKCIYKLMKVVFSH
jgi:hypothetical protein